MSAPVTSKTRSPFEASSQMRNFAIAACRVGWTRLWNLRAPPGTRRALV